ncbi:transient receptor potential cation channel subfamily V member 1-like, partial [Protobothrops mucrosquamatus]|uniref:transient receptor potential cation channel subfamily V member 1-like n=1 Tax=Protobothrops mucrosquamatus TaxID=103944 RepID=UPI0010FAF9D5
MVKYLLDNPYQKARLTEQDSMGNTVLHALVMVANDMDKNTEVVVKMYDEILKKAIEINPSCKLEEIVNREQLTPLTLAVKTGKVEILKHILHREIPEFQDLSRKLTEWTYGPIHTSLYDLTSIDTCEKNSALEILAYNSDTPNRYKMVVLEPLNNLLQHKWEFFIKKRFFFSLCFHLIFMLAFTTTAYFQPPKGEPFVPTTMTFQDVVGPVIVLIGGIYFFITQSVHFWRRRFSLKSLLVDRCFEIFLFVQACTMLASSIMYFAKMEDYVLPMVFALLLGWVNMLYYTRGLQQTGIYIVMIQKVVYSELLQTALELFRFTIGMGDLEYNEKLKHSDVAMLLVLLFVILTYILLLNMLIALMSETVTKVSGYSQSVWQLQRAIAILELERSWIWCWKKTEKADCFRSVVSQHNRDERCFL